LAALEQIAALALAHLGGVGVCRREWPVEQPARERKRVARHFESHAHSGEDGCECLAAGAGEAQLGAGGGSLEVAEQ
jgi:hypothetical protein